MFKKNFIKLCNERNESPSYVCRQIGIAPATFSCWTDESVPRKATLQRIADYFGVSVEELLGKDEVTASEKNVFWERFSYLCESNKKSPAEVAEGVGCGAGHIKSWKMGHVPKWGILLKLAGTLDTSIAYLLGRDGDAKEPPQHLYELDETGIQMIPLFEDVSAGFGVLAENNVVEYIPLHFKSSAEAEETICIRVRGDSMYPKIEDGDIIQVHKQTSVDSGSIAVVLLDGTAGLVKKVEYGPDWIALHSINPMYQPMRFERAEVTRLKVLGLVKKIIKEV